MLAVNQLKDLKQVLIGLSVSLLRTYGILLVKSREKMFPLW
nr:MAG TPA: hypothetical protein [Bacteriophage sp.]